MRPDRKEEPYVAKEGPRNPLVTVDVIIETPDGIVLVERKNPPPGWALPGGFVDYGESLEAAAVREAAEETGMEIELLEQLFSYSAPDRDPRHHTVTTVFVARAQGTPRAGDDAGKAKVFSPDRLPTPMAFDHDTILDDYRRIRAGESRSRVFRERIGAPTG
jgi:8-oxo-dGTP diphosphatase